MLVLALDTSTFQFEAALVSVTESGPVRVLASRSRATEKGMHSRLLPGLLEEMVAGAGRTLSDVEGFAAGLGPGSFTGLRTGLSTLKALAYATGRPIAGASSLASMSLSALDELGETGTAPLLVPVLDARRGQVYAGFHRPADGGVALAKGFDEQVLAPGALLERLDAEVGPVHLFGSGLKADAALLGDRRARPELPAFPSAVALARLCAPRLVEGDVRAALTLQPTYVRQDVTDRRS
jgi:tRNA threonylcarbamoyladenosine biosynthesis protein TsaB